MKIGAFLLTATANLGIGIILFFFLIIALNGYSESQATPGLILFIVWILFFSLAAAVFSFFTVTFLTKKKSFSPFAAAVFSTIGFVFIGGILDFIGIFAAIGLIEVLR
ncbi:MAG TPA: hypothetical protein VK892_03680 [Pyrinomonadaceae bacterium]|nr:hypothetical protein [Pyrinomonadaceae bacterium]